MQRKPADFLDLVMRELVAYISLLFPPWSVFSCEADSWGSLRSSVQKGWILSSHAVSERSGSVSWDSVPQTWKDLQADPAFPATPVWLASSAARKHKVLRIHQGQVMSSPPLPHIQYQGKDPKLHIVPDIRHVFMQLEFWWTLCVVSCLKSELRLLVIEFKWVHHTGQSEHLREIHAV